MFKKIIGSLLAVSILASMGTAVFAEDDLSRNEQEALISNHFSSINSDNWSEWASYYTPSVRNSYSNFATDLSNQSDNTGILTVDNG